MAVFSNLHHVGEVLVELISDNLPSVPTGTVQVGPPLDTATGAAEDVRVTMLWVTPQPTHRNDGWERTPEGGLRPPPLSLSAFFMVTTYGSSAEDPIRAHELLGNVMQIFHTQPELSLPLAALADRGEGSLRVVQVPTAADLMEKIYSPMQLKHRAWVLFEVGPIQLPMDVDDATPGPVVAPGGIRFEGVEVLSRPRITRVTPSRQAQGGRVRVDVELFGRSLAQILAEGIAVPLASLDALTAGSAYALTLPNVDPEVVATGTRALRLEVGDAQLDPPQQFSVREQITVLDASTPTLDAPTVASHSMAGDLVLDGRALGSLGAVVLWPDEGIADPSAVKTITPASFDATSVTLSAAELAGAGLSAGSWRISARIGDHVYTPYVLLELTA
ncbi:DUF4255 domain-containing protein [Pseudenhygromyxa sp. WMMC2535]|uniref:Pvc16 family protein n=1 Tax=Pseudenhygromyxa sp. WMMC2535 TaxID=2712867 RepID=UPI0015546973|nr:Pvc16 family protein [Pseudenhygromyxa sp. WMMC2535]NVB37038.1 DUF4255 domain-containing protein [Pseudenhygromyxa sp. WMMC2535]